MGKHNSFKTLEKRRETQSYLSLLQKETTLGCQIDEYTRLFGTKETWRKKQTQRQTKVFNKNPPYSFIWPYSFNWHLWVVRCSLLKGSLILEGNFFFGPIPLKNWITVYTHFRFRFVILHFCLRMGQKGKFLLRRLGQLLYEWMQRSVIWNIWRWRQCFLQHKTQMETSVQRIKISISSSPFYPYLYIQRRLSLKVI